MRALAQPARPPKNIADAISAICSCSSAPIRRPAGSTAAASRSIARGFVLTGVAAANRATARSPPLETTVPGVFAVGDVRSGSVKRVGGAIGEGAQVVAALHGFLGDAGKPAL